MLIVSCEVQAANSRKKGAHKKRASQGLLRVLAHPEAYPVVIGNQSYRKSRKKLKLPAWKNTHEVSKAFASHQAILNMRDKGYIPVKLSINLNDKYTAKLHPINRGELKDPLGSVRDLIRKAVVEQFGDCPVYFYLALHDVAGSPKEFGGKPRIRPHLHGLLAVPPHKGTLTAAMASLEDAIKRKVASKYREYGRNRAVEVSDRWGRRGKVQKVINLGWYDYIFSGSKSYFIGPIATSQELTREAERLWLEWRRR
ncbi:hypothetical protein M0G74_02390 [Microbulbifer sp. CAU 1566]|uniref:hypothetical protein n=1 Tax=Microbulbifer sp. CAU 1566 TaxID=2933269 RepID=UPI0020035CFA|nr:hypothetical protein [Microbulbifer sp. CAU 1566]MCK7596114.1 hypothetical protein [Microbulbifer sp. CAU 1566]